MVKSFLTAEERRNIRGHLQTIVSRLGANLDTLRDEALRPVGVESVGEQASPAQESDLGNRDAESSRALTLLGSEEQILAEATAALERLNDGKFGHCEDCGKQISRARLRALPYARRCVRCEKTPG